MSPKASSTEQVILRHGPLVMRIIWALIPSKDDAHDIFQDTFLQHHLALTQGRTIHNPKAWLCQTARNGAFKLRRLNSRQAAATDPDVLDKHPAKGTHPDHSLLMEQIRDLAATLPDRQAQVFAMRNFEQLSFAQIAEQLDCTEEAARASGYKALKKIRSLMGHRQEDSHV